MLCSRSAGITSSLKIGVLLVDQGVGGAAATARGRGWTSPARCRALPSSMSAKRTSKNSSRLLDDDADVAQPLQQRHVDALGLGQDRRLNSRIAFSRLSSGTSGKVMD